MTVTRVDVKRLIPAGGINPDTGETVEGLEEAIAEFMKTFPHSPVELTTYDELVNSRRDVVKMMSQAVQSAVGTLVGVTDTAVTIELFSDDTEVLSNPEDFRAAFVILKDGRGKVRVCKVVLLRKVGDTNV